MSIVWLEGFETDATAESYQHKYFAGLSEQTPESHPPGRLGGKCIRGKASPNQFQLGAQNVGVHNTLVVGLAVRSYLPKDGSTLIAFTGVAAAEALVIRHHAAAYETSQFSFSNKGVELYRTPTYRPHKWIYIEAWMRFETPGLGINTIFRINGMAVYNRTVDNGVNAVIPGYDRFYLAGEARELSTDGYVDVDDLYIFNHTQDGPHYFIWDSPNCMVETLHPNAGTHSEWTPGGVVNNYQAVDDSRDGGSIDVDDDNSYVIGDNETQLDLYKVDEPKHLSDEIYAVAVETDARADTGEGTTPIDILVQTGDYAPNEISPQPPGYVETYGRTVYYDNWNPSTGQQFKVEDFRNTQIGVGAKENFGIIIEPPDDEEELNLDYGSASAPTGTPLDFGSASNPTGPNVDLGNA